MRQSIPCIFTLILLTWNNVLAAPTPQEPTTTSSPPPSEFVGDTVIHHKLTQIRNMVRRTLDQIEGTAIRENPKVGQQLVEKLEVYFASKVRASYDKAMAQETVTKEEFEDIIDHLFETLHDTRGQIKDELNSLTTRDKIEALLEEKEQKAKEMTAEVYLIYTSPDRPHVPLLVDLSTVVRNAVDDIEDEAIEENPEVGQVIKDKLEEYFSGRARPIYLKALQMETLPEKSMVEGLLNKFLLILHDTKSQVASELASLTPETQNEINEHFLSKEEKAKEIAQQLIALATDKGEMAMAAASYWSRYPTVDHQYYDY